MAIGNRGTVLQSGRFQPHLEVLAYHPGRGPEILIHGVAAHPHQLQGSSNFIHWLSLLPATSTAEEMLYLDEEAPLHPSRFYRLIEP